MISFDSKTERTPLLVVCCVKQKRAGGLCCGAIRASGYEDNRSPNILSKRDKGALLNFLRLWGDNSHHQHFIMCLVFYAYLSPVASWLWDSPYFITLYCVSLCTISTHQTSFGLLSLYSRPLSTVSHHWICCWCQVKVLLKINRIHTIMSSDRMSPTLPQIKPQPAASTLAPTCTHPAETARLCDVTCKPH